MENSDIPIDINSGKLLEWLINRRHCKRDWQTHILSIREKINNAIQDMPVHDRIANLLSGTYITYFHCKMIVEILKETEADTKNLFGRYGSQRMKDWQEIIHLYEKDNVYLAEAAQMLIRNINYEVPGFKKQIQKLDQIQREHEKKEAEYKKSESTAHSEFSNLCKQLGISGNKIKKELSERLVELPDIYNKIAKKIKSLDKVVEFYSAFVNFTLGNQHNGGCVPIIKYLIERGNTTTYEWIYGEPPLSIKESSLNFDLDENEDDIANETIDFGTPDVETIDFTSLDLNEPIDFGNDNPIEDAEGDIDWGGAIDNSNVAPDEAIDFEISLEESGIVVEDTGNDGGNAVGLEALTILDNPNTRNDFIDQLFELEGFLKLRLYEFKSDNSKNLLNMSHLQESAVLQLATSESTQNMLDNVQVLISEILDSKVQHLHNIKHSPRYVDILSANLKQKQKLIKKMQTLQQTMRDKQAETREQIMTLKPLLKLVIEKTKQLQHEIQKEISHKYNNRVVRLTGGIHTL